MNSLISFCDILNNIASRISRHIHSLTIDGVNMSERFSRTQLLLGRSAMETLKNSRVIVFGVGGVGGYVVEALARSGVGAIDIVDNDTVCMSNLNRQIIATTSTLGMYKVDAAEQRMLDINPDIKVTKHCMFYLPETADRFDFSQYDYVVDAIDTVTGKIQIVMQAEEMHVPVISSMGAGNKMNPAQLEVADIYQTSVCPLAKVMRRELKKRGIKKLKVVYSKEPAITPLTESTESSECIPNGSSSKDANPVGQRKRIPGSNAFVPSVAGLIIASEVIKDLVSFQRQ